MFVLFLFFQFLMYSNFPELFWAEIIIFIGIFLYFFIRGSIELKNDKEYWKRRGEKPSFFKLCNLW